MNGGRRRRLRSCTASPGGQTHGNPRRLKWSGFGLMMGTAETGAVSRSLVSSPAAISATERRFVSIDRLCQFQRYLRIRADRAEINANVAMLFANAVCERDLPRNSSMPSDLVRICQWASLFTQSMDSCCATELSGGGLWSELRMMN